MTLTFSILQPVQLLSRLPDEQERLANEALSAVAPTRDEVFDQQLAEEAVERLRQNRAANG